MLYAANRLESQCRQGLPRLIGRCASASNPRQFLAAYLTKRMRIGRVGGSTPMDRPILPPESGCDPVTNGYVTLRLGTEIRAETGQFIIWPHKGSDFMIVSETEQSQSLDRH